MSTNGVLLHPSIRLVFYGGCGFIATAIIAEIATIIAATEITCDHDRDHDDVVVPASTVRFQKGGLTGCRGPY
jgi:hypothetical protein